MAKPLNLDYPEKLSYPPKRVKFGSSLVDFQKSYDDNGDRSSAILYYPRYYAGPNIKYIDRFPSVYSHAGGGHFTKSHNVLWDQYFENLQLIDQDQFFLWGWIYNANNRGYRVSLHGKPLKKDEETGKTVDPGTRGIAKILRWHPAKVIANREHLVDCLLLHCITRIDLPGAPLEYVIHTPFTVKELTPARVSMLRGRIADKTTKHQRIKVNPGPGRNHAATSKCFQYDHRLTQRAFGDRTEHFTDFALNFFRKHLTMLKTERGKFQAEYRSDLEREMDTWMNRDRRYYKWNIRDKKHKTACMIAANKFRLIYCPLEQELISGSELLGTE